jgi:hypothetical protein
MIRNPHVFVIYEPGMFGTFFCSLFMHHKLWQGPKIGKQFNIDENDVTAHKSGYVDCLKNFHGHNHSLQLTSKKRHELMDFFNPIKNVEFGVHRLSSYYFTGIKFEDYFKNFVKIIIKPDPNQIYRYAERMEDTVYVDYNKQWWTKNMSKKDWSKIPPWFIKKMSVKEKTKYLQQHTNFLETSYTYNPKTDLMFDPNNITDMVKLQGMIDATCLLLGIDKFKLPEKKIKIFLDKNRNYL